MGGTPQQVVGDREATPSASSYGTFSSNAGGAHEPLGAADAATHDRTPMRDAASTATDGRVAAHDAADTRMAAHDAPHAPRDSRITPSNDAPHDRPVLDASPASDASTDPVSGPTTPDADAGDRLCSGACTAAPHLLISEVVFRSPAGEMIEIVNPTSQTILLTGYWLSDHHDYPAVAGGLVTCPASDFAARFPAGAAVPAGAYRTVAIANASGGSTSFEVAYGRKPDFELRPLAHGAVDDPAVPNMVGAASSISVGALASLTDDGEPVVLFQLESSGRVRDVDYVFYGRPSAVNPMVDKSDADGGRPHDAADTAAEHQHAVPIGAGGMAIQRCHDAEIGERSNGGNGLFGHDEMSEDPRGSFVNAAPTPGQGAPAEACTSTLPTAKRLPLHRSSPEVLRPPALERTVH